MLKIVELKPAGLSAFGGMKHSPGKQNHLDISILIQYVKHMSKLVDLCVIVLAEQGILSPESTKDFQLMAQFRNKIVHYYEKIDPEQVYAIYKGNLQTFDAFRQKIEGFITQKEASTETGR